MTTEDAPNNNEEVSTLQKKIIRQVEYYFGDHNLPRDRFLREKITEDEGWVSIQCLTTFNRLKVLSSDEEAIADAVRKSKNDLVEVSDDGKKIRRDPMKPVPDNNENYRQSEKGRVVYCKGFPSDYTLEKLEEFFEDKGKVENISMRWRAPEKTFKGSCFVKFKTAEDAKSFLALESVKCGDTEIFKAIKEDYQNTKSEEEKAKKAAANPNNEKKEEEKVEEEGNDDTEVNPSYEKGCVISFKDVGEQTSREDVKELFTEETGWIDFKIGDTEGFVRFNGENSAQKALETIKKDEDGKIKLRGVETTMRILDGDEEKEYWIKAEKERAKRKARKDDRGKKRRNQWQNNFRGGKKFRRGGKS